MSNCIFILLRYCYSCFNGTVLLQNAQIKTTILLKLQKLAICKQQKTYSFVLQKSNNEKTIFLLLLSDGQNGNTIK